MQLTGAAHLGGVEGDVLLIPTVIPHVMAQADIVIAHNLTIMQRAVVWPVYRHSPANSLLVRRHRHPCRALRSNLHLLS